MKNKFFLFVLSILFIIPFQLFAADYYGKNPINLAAPGASIDDSAGNGDTTVTYSADKIFDLLALKQADLSILKGTYTNGYFCKYTAAGTLLDCNVDPAGYQAADAELTALAGLPSAANAIPYFTGSGTAGVISSSANIVSLLGSADYATARTNLGTWGVSGSITDEQLVCSETTGGTNLLKSCGAKTTNNATATHLLCTDDSNEVENCTLSGLAITGTTSPTITVVGLQNGTDPTVDAAGEVAVDTDGANITGDTSVRLYDGTNQVLLERKLKTIHVTVVKPQDLADAVRDAFPFWSNETGMTFTITSIKAWSGTDNATFMVEKSDANGANKADVDELDCTTDGTGVYTDTETTLTSATVTAGQLLWIDFDDSDDPAWVKVTIEGWFNADVD